MRDKDLYGKILGIEAPWSVNAVELALDKVRVPIVNQQGRLPCPDCEEACSRYDARPRRWRHLDTCQYRTILIAQVPRIECPEHGVRQIQVPWSEPGSGFTALFEALIIDWLQEASIAAVAQVLGISGDGVAGVMDRALRRGLERREQRAPVHTGVDETSVQKRHEYVTVVSDQGGGEVVHIADGRGRDSLDAFYRGLSEEDRGAVESIAMDMGAAYIASTKEHIPGADGKIAFDKFHVAQHLTEAVDKVRKYEHKVLLEQGDGRLKGSKHLWLQHPEHRGDEGRIAFEPLRESSLKTSRAWAIQELTMEIWEHAPGVSMRRAWKRWYAWAIRSRLEPIKEVARMIKRHLQGILNAITQAVTNARAEGLNAKIQWIKRTARGFRNRNRFRDAIYFHLGGLDLYPEPLTH